jgi:hypothetical protein
MNVPSIKTLVFVDFVCYLNLLLLFVSYDLFYVVGGFMAAVCTATQSSFNRVILAQNISGSKERILFDNKQSLMRTTGSSVGGLVALFYLFDSFDISALWLSMYIIYDIDFVFKLYLIRKGRIKYDSVFENNELERTI